MNRLQRAACTAVVLASAAAAAPARAESSSERPAHLADLRPRVEVSVSATGNLIHWVDNLAGSSAGKTTPVYRHYWDARFGIPDDADRRALESFARIRRLAIPIREPGIGNDGGCLPVWTEGLGWRQVFMQETMKAGSIAELRRGLSPWLSEGDLTELVSVLERFRPRFERAWRDMAHVRRFESRLRRWLKEGPMLDYLAEVAAFLEVDPGLGPAMKISLMALPYDGATHAEADGEHLLIEIRPPDDPQDQVQVVAHEATHFLMRLMSARQLDTVARQAHAEREAGALLWRYLWEGLPTALGQGLAEARMGRDGSGLHRRWYHLESVDQAAKLFYPVVSRAFDRRVRLYDGAVAETTRALRDSPLFTRALAIDFLTTAFYAGGEGMAPGLQYLRSRLGLRRDQTTGVFELGDAAGTAAVRRYECLSGVALVRPQELERASALDGSPVLSSEIIRLAKEEAGRGKPVIAAGLRAGGGPVFYLVAPQPEALASLIEAFGKLRGVPAVSVVVPAGESALP